MYTDFKKVLTKENFPCGVARLNELTSVGITKHHLREMCKSRTLTRLEYGVYKIETIKNFDKRAVIAKALPEAVFCMSDSLYIYGLRKAKPFVSEVAVPRRISYCKCQKIKDSQNIKFRFITKEYELGKKNSRRHKTLQPRENCLRLFYSPHRVPLPDFA